MSELKCPGCSTLMEQKELKKRKNFREVDIEYPVNAYVCPSCGLEAGTVTSAGEVQRAMADAYRKKTGLLTGQKIKELRKARSMTQEQLSLAMKVGIASIKRWESGMIQSRSMDNHLRRIFNGEAWSITGNRDMSLPRIKLIVQTFEKILGRRLLKKNDRFLFLAKYLWYADMLAFKRLGRGMTGASYAALTYGPQMNNYKDLLQPIKESDSTQAEPLSTHELAIIKRIAETFPSNEDVYQAAHQERTWQEAPTGSLLAYSSAHELTEIQ